MDYKLRFPIETPGSEGLTSIADAVRQVSEGTKIGAGNLQLFQQLLNETAQRTGSVSTALKELSRLSSPFQQFAKDVQAFVREQERAQTEVQKLGRMMELAYAENTRRDAVAAAAREKAAAVAAAARDREAQEVLAHQNRIEQVVGRLGGRLGGLATGIPGGGFIGSQAIGGLGLSGPAAAALGGGLVAAFAAVDISRHVNELGKWVQEQKNAAAEIGVTTREMMILARISDETGLKLQGVARSAAQMGEEVAAGGLKARQIEAALTDIGLTSATAFKPATAALDDIAHALAKIPDQVDRSQRGFALLGDGGRQLAAIADQWDKLTASTAKRLIPEEQQKQLDQARQTIKEIGETWDLLIAKAAKPVNFVLNEIRNVVEGSTQGGQSSKRPPIGLTPRGQTLLRDLFPGFIGDRSAPAITPPIRTPGPPESLHLSPNPPPQVSGTDIAAQAMDRRVKEWRQMLGEIGTQQDRRAAKMAPLLVQEAQLQKRFERGDVGEADAKKQLAQIEARKQALLDERGIDNEILTLREKLRSVQDGELTGIAQINAETQSLLDKVRERRRLGEVGTKDYQTEIDLIQKIGAAEIARFNQRLAITRVQNERRIGTTGFEAQAGVERNLIEGQARIADARGRADQGGMTEEDIQRSRDLRLQLAQLDFNLAARRVQDMRAESAEREKVVHDQMKLEAEEAAIRQAQIQAGAAFAKQASDAEKQATLDRIALEKKEAHDRLQANREIANIGVQALRENFTREAARGPLQSGAMVDIRAEALRRAQLTPEAHILEQYQSRLDLAQKLYALDAARAAVETDTEKQRVDMAKAYADLRREQQDAELEREQAILKLEEKRVDAFKSVAVGFIGAAQDHRLPQFFRQQGQKIEDTIVGNAAAMIYKPVSGLLSNRGAGPETWFGKLLQGTPFGKTETADPASPQMQTWLDKLGFGKSGTADPNIQATALNTSATTLNTAAIVALIESLTGPNGPDTTTVPGMVGVSQGQLSLQSILSQVAGSRIPGISSILQSTGLQIPGLTSNGGAFESGGLLGQILNLTRTPSVTSVGQAIGTLDRAVAGSDSSGAGSTPPVDVPSFGSRAAEDSPGVVQQIRGFGQMFGTAGNTSIPLSYYGTTGQQIGTLDRAVALQDEKSQGRYYDPMADSYGYGPRYPMDERVDTGGADNTTINVPTYGSTGSISPSKAGAFTTAGGQSSIAAGMFNGSGAGNFALSAAASAGAAYMGVTSAIHDFKMGGARGITGGIGDVALTAAAFDPEPISKGVLAMVGTVSKMISSIFGDPKQIRQDQINAEINRNRYLAPASLTVTSNENGQYTDFDRFGKIRGSSFNAFNIVESGPAYNHEGYLVSSGNQLGPFDQGYKPTGQPYSPYISSGIFNNPDIQGYLNSLPRASAPQVALPPAQSPMAPPINLTVQALDARSIIDRSMDIGLAVRQHLQQGGPLVQEMQRTINPR